MTDEDESPYAEEGIITPLRSNTTITIKAGGRMWEGTPEELRALRDRLNEVEFRD